MSGVRAVTALLMALHGVAHVPGFLATWQLSRMEGLPCKTTLLGGRVDAGASGIRALGLLWVLAAAAFLYCAWAAAANRPD